MHPIFDVLKQVVAWSQRRGIPVHVVGGLLRDTLLNRPLPGNVDLVLPGRTLELGRELANLLQGAYVPLDEEAGSVRLVVPAGESVLEIDLNDYRAPTLEQDLGLRDFACNALALPLEAWIAAPQGPWQLLDPLGGQGDLRANVLKPCFAGAFEADPLRVLRGFRLAAQLDFRLSAEAEEGMRAAVEGLARVSAERIRDEWFALLESPRAGAALDGMNAMGVLDALFPELAHCRGVDQGDFHHLDVLEHELEAVRFGDRWLETLETFDEPLRGELLAYCRRAPVDGRSLKAHIKLAALIHDIGKPDHRQDHGNGEVWFLGHEHTGAELAGPLVKRLALSRRECELQVNLVRHHLRPGFLSRMPELTRRALYRFYKELGDAGPACVLEWWCDRNATRGATSRTDQIAEQHAFMVELLSAYFFREEEVVRPKRLVDGNRLMEHFGLRPGPRVGALLARIEEAQAEGRVANADEALEFARVVLENPSPDAD